MPISRARLAEIARSGLFRQIAEQTAATLAVQLLGAVTTLSFVHLLPKHEYAMFGWCLTTVAFIAVTSDLGLMAAMNYFWRTQVADGQPFATRYAAIRRLRLILFGVSGIVACIALAWLEHSQGVSWQTIVLSLVLVLLLAWTQILAQMTILAIRLGQQLRRAYLAELAGALVRAVLAVLAFALAMHEAWFPLASLGVASLVTMLLVRNHLPTPFRTDAPPTPAALKNVLAYLLPTVPSVLIFSAQDMFVVWLASLGGGTVVMAQTFALGRLSAIFVTLNSIMANVIMPWIVNLKDDGHARRNGLISVGVMAAFCATLTLFAALFPDWVLMLLGKDYSDLQLPLVLALTAASLQLVAMSIGQLNRTMGWVKFETPVNLVHALLIVASVPFFRFDTTVGVLTFTIYLQVIGLLEMILIHVLGPRGLMQSAQADPVA